MLTNIRTISEVDVKTYRLPEGKSLVKPEYGRVLSYSVHWSITPSTNLLTGKFDKMFMLGAKSGSQLCSIEQTETLRLSGCITS